LVPPSAAEKRRIAQILEKTRNSQLFETGFPFRNAAIVSLIRSIDRIMKFLITAAIAGALGFATSQAAEIGKEGYLEPSKLGEKAAAEVSKATHILVDSGGTLGKTYGAKVTPHMMIISKDGTLAYSGAIDSKPTTDVADIDGADLLFANALDSVLDGKEIANAKNEPYGCGVKY
jgi:hypothetical protein